MKAEATAALTSRLQEQFETPAKQAHASRLGMWIFLSTEILLFAGLFVSYGYYRYLFSADFHLASRHLKTGIGTVNTFILLTSSFTVAMGLHFARAGRGRLTAALLGVSVLLALAFMGLKAVEYHADFVEGVLPGRFLSNPELRTPGASVFLSLYFLMTGLHALHVTAGVTVLAVLAGFAWRGSYSEAYHTPMELGAMYWHLVDAIWIFLWPLLYLV